jgi:hypothetical protein
MDYFLFKVLTTVNETGTATDNDIENAICFKGICAMQFQKEFLHFG